MIFATLALLNTGLGASTAIAAAIKAKPRIKRRTGQCDYCGGMDRELGRHRCLTCGAPTVEPQPHPVIACSKEAVSVDVIYGATTLSVEPGVTWFAANQPHA